MLNTQVYFVFVIQIVQIVVRFVSGNEQSVAGCFNCFINGHVSDADRSSCDVS